MEIEMKKDFENKLLNRRELYFVTVYSGKTPSRAEVREEISKKLNLNPETTVVVRISPLYGTMKSEIVVHSYASKEDMAIEQKYLFERMKPREKKAAPQPQAQKVGAAEKAQEKKQEKAPEKAPEQNPEKAAEKAPEKKPEKAAEKAPEKVPEQEKK